MNDHRLRQGHHEPRNLWEYPADTPPESKSGVCAGQVFNPDLAAEIVAAVNAARDGQAAERQRIRNAIQAEIDDHDPDGTLRALMDNPQPGQGDPGHAGNSWWRAYVHVGGPLNALACTEPDRSDDE